MPACVQAALTAIEYHLPERRLTNAELNEEFGESVMEQVTKMTGVLERRIAQPGECASDLAAAAAKKLFANYGIPPGDIDFILYCTETPDYFLPASACLLQQRLGVPTRAGALDFNLGCSGYIYGLSLAKGLIETGQAQRVLLLTGDTPSKLIESDDRTVRPLFGDAASASLIEARTIGAGENGAEPLIGPFIFGTDGAGSEALIVEQGGFRALANVELSGNGCNGQPRKMRFSMNGARVYDFMRHTVPQLLNGLLEKAALAESDIDMFVFHQASKLILDRLRRALRIPEAAFCFCMEDVGNTVSSTIPIALKRLDESGKVADGAKLALAAFGVGFSWGATVIRWQGIEI